MSYKYVAVKAGKDGASRSARFFDSLEDLYEFVNSRVGEEWITASTNWPALDKWLRKLVKKLSAKS